MSKLEKIKEKIMAEAQMEVSAIQQETEESLSALMTEALSKAKQEAERQVSYAKSRCESITEQVLSRAQLKARDQVLQAKQGVVARVLDEAEGRLSKLDDKDLSRLLKKAIEEKPLEEGDVILLPKGSKVDLPDGAVVEEDESLRAGFSIRRGGVIEKHDYVEILRLLRDDLEAGILQAVSED